MDTGYYLNTHKEIRHPGVYTAEMKPPRKKVHSELWRFDILLVPAVGLVRDSLLD